MRSLALITCLAASGVAYATPFTTTEFSEAEGWEPHHTRTLADVDGDGRDDIVGFHDDGVWVALATSTGFLRSQRWSGDFAALDGWADRERFAADIDGDGRADLIGIAPDRVWIAFSTGTQFDPAEWRPAGPENLIVNGSFEAPALGERWRILPQNDVPGWTAWAGDSGNVMEIHRHHTGTDGAQHVELTVRQGPAHIGQNVPTVPGQDYVLQFDAGARNGLAENVVNTYWNGQQVSWVNYSGIGFDAPVWHHQVAQVQAEDVAAHVRFHTVDNQHGEMWMGGLVDNVLLRGPSPVICPNGCDSAVFHRVADVNGDGQADLVGFAPDGIFVALSRGQAFGQSRLWLADMSTAQGWHAVDNPRVLADMNNDGRADLVGFGPDAIHVAYSTGADFEPPVVVPHNMVRSVSGWSGWSHPRTVADIDGDGFGDILGFANYDTYIARNTAGQIGGAFRFGYGFGARQGWHVFRHPRLFGDVNGDGSMDLVGFGAEAVDVRLSEGGRFNVPGLTPASPLTTRSFSTADGFVPNRHRREVGDVNGDGRADIGMFHERGVLVSLSTGAGFTAPTQWSREMTLSDQWWTGAERYFADFDGDGLADLIGFGGRDVMVGFSDGQRFAPMVSVGDGYRASYNHFGYGNPQFTRHVGDFNGDGRTDVLGFRAEGVFVSVSDGDQLSASENWLADMTTDFGWDATIEPRALGDVDGDGRDDLVGFRRDGVVVAFSTGASFEAPAFFDVGFGRDTGGWRLHHPRRLMDIDGDGDDDIIGFGSDRIFAAIADGRTLTYVGTIAHDMSFTEGWTLPRSRLTGDFDADGREDVVGFGDGITRVLRSTGMALVRPRNTLLAHGDTLMSSLRPSHVNSCLWGPVNGGVARQIRCGEGGWLSTWKITAEIDGRVLLRTPEGQCLRRSENAVDGALETGPCDRAAGWHLEESPEGGHRLRSLDNGALCVGVINGSNENRAPLTQQTCSDAPHQRWRIEVPHPQVRRFDLRADNDECVHFMTPFTTGACGDGRLQIVDTGYGDQIRNPASGLCLAHVTEGELPVERPCAVEPAQLWRFEPVDDRWAVRAQNYTGRTSVHVCRTEQVYMHFVGFLPITTCGWEERAVADAMLWGIDGLHTQSVVRLALHRPGPDLPVVLFVTIENITYVVSDPPMIMAMLAGHGVTVDAAQQASFFGGPVEPAEPDDTVPLRRLDDVDACAHIDSGTCTETDDTGEFYGPVSGEVRGGAYIAVYDESRPGEAAIGVRLVALEAHGQWGSDRGTSAGVGIMSGASLGAHGSWGANDRYGFTVDIIAIRLSLYLSTHDAMVGARAIGTVFLHGGRGVVWMAENAVDGLTLPFELAADWVEGAASDVWDAISFW